MILFFSFKFSQTLTVRKKQLQVKEGIDAVIVDNVLAIRKGLTGSDNCQTAKDLLSPADGSPSMHASNGAASKESHSTSASQNGSIGSGDGVVVNKKAASVVPVLEQGLT